MEAMYMLAQARFSTLVVLKSLVLKKERKTLLNSEWVLNFILQC